MIEPNEPEEQRSASDRRVVLALLFTSGAAALIYEVSWSRQIGLLFGHTVHSAAVVLTCYFVGMAIGSVLAARWVGRVIPLLGYGVAELVVAGWVPWVPRLLDAVEQSSWAAWLSHPEPVVQVLIRWGLAFGLLLPATVGLGASLPFMAEHLSPDRRLAPGRVALAYALNTAGALVGVVLTTAVLMLAVGVRGSGWIAAALSGGCGIVACLMAIRGRAGGQESKSGVESKSEAREVLTGQSVTDSKGSVGFWLALAALSGFGTLGLQVLYTRMFSLVFHNSTYTFGAVLTVFLAGLAIGSAAVARLHRRMSAERLLGIAAGLGAAGVSLSVPVFLGLTNLDSFTFGSTFTAYLVGVFGLVALVVLPPVSVLGAVLPGIWKAAGASGMGGGAVVGWLTAGNALAAALGALLASVVFLPSVGLWPSIVVFSLIFGLIPVVLLVRSGRRLAAVGVVLVLVGLGGVAITAPGRVRTLPPDPRIRILAGWEGAYGLVEVVQVASGNRILRQNLHYGLGSTGRSTVRELRQGHLPLLLHPDPREVLFLGLGTGLTSGAATIHPQVDRIEIVELIPEVVETARFFEPENLGVVGHPKVTIRIDDARHDLLASGKTYDAIISDLFVPWESRAGYLYTVEQFRLARSRLNPGGLFCLWLPLYQLGATELTMIADSFASVFPSTSIWWGQLASDRAMLALIGSEAPLTIDPNRVDATLPLLTDTRNDPERYLDSAETLARLYGGDWPRPAPGTRLNTDEHPRVEFLAPIRQRNDRLLSGERLLDLFDQRFRRLPFHQILDEPKPRDQGIVMYRRRVWQREQLTSGAL
ncbi:spermine/spermidine synthase domain-containing protein [Tautonia marina]|uniref:spermine/spermidine synthase domain-containing protein n=1 Tax=Tautonia marina TaxID=2653855 RepID=UPI001260812A|nr:spermidine synthase [Tautonia marina]